MLRHAHLCALLLIAMTSLSLPLYAHASERSDFRDAKKQAKSKRVELPDKIGVWNEFLESHPDGKYAAKARDAKEELCQEYWIGLETSARKPRGMPLATFRGVLAGRFVTVCFDTANEPTAHQIRENYYWDRALEASTAQDRLNGLRLFVDKYPESARATEAQEMIRETRAEMEEQAWSAAKKADSVAAIEEFLSENPNSVYAGEANAILEQLLARALPRAAKQGDVEGVKASIQVASVDMRSEALMEAVWGLLHTTKVRRPFDPMTSIAESQAHARRVIQEIESDPDMPEAEANRKMLEAAMWSPPLFEEKRTSDVPEETYLWVIRTLLEASANPRRYAYADFSSNEVQAYRDKAKKKEFVESALEKGYSELRTSFGASEKSGTYVDYGSGGLSIEQVAEIHEASALLHLLKQYK